MAEYSDFVMLRHHVFRLFSITFFLVLVLEISAFNVASAYEENFVDPLQGSFLEPRVQNKALIDSFPSTLQSHAAILFEQETGTILYQKNAHVVIPPASLTKIMTIMLAFDHLSQHQISLQELVNISPNSFAVNAPPRSSLMFLGPEQSPRWMDLLLGLAVSSGNDASVAVAEACAGSLSKFVDRMNQKAKSLGLKQTIFVEPSGYDKKNQTTIADFAYLLFYYLNNYAQSLVLLHSVPQFTYPNQAGLGGISQGNRNRLLNRYLGLDGIKTGYIDESGYNFAFSANREGMRLTGLILGAQSEEIRFADARALLDWGFSNFSLGTITRPKIGPIRVWNGTVGSIELDRYPVRLVLPKPEWEEISLALELSAEIRAPLSTSTRLGWLSLQLDQSTVRYKIPILSGRVIERANPIQLLGEEVYLTLRSWIGVPLPSYP